MALDERYVTAVSLSQVFLDKETGEPLNGEARFFKDTNRAVPKLVYELSGSPPNYTYTPLPDPVSIVNGVCVNGSGDNIAIYAYPYDDLGNIELYYVVVVNSEDTEQEIREAWPNIADTVDPTKTENSITNELSNSQFVDVLFNDEFGVTIETGGAVSGAEYEIAPSWFLLVSSNAAASIEVNRTSLAGSLNIETNPPYRLDIIPEGGTITSLKLVQRLYNNPDIWSNGFIAGSLVATSLDGISHTIEMLYAPSISPSANTIFSDTTGDSGYVRLSGTIELDAGTNTDAPPDGYVDIQVVLPVNGEVGITSVQAVGLNTDEEDVLYDQQPVNRQEDFLFHYYNPLIQEVPVPSILQGWDFKVNPAQFGSSGSITTHAAQYMWDQTIGWQSVNNLVTYSRAAQRALTMTHAATTGQMALVQYMGGSQLRTLLSNDFSVVIDAYTNLVGGAAGTVSLWYTTDGSLPVVATGTNQCLISTLDANGKPATFHGNWTEIPRNYRGDARFTIPYSSDSLTSEMPLEGWNRVSNTIRATATFAAIVVGFEEQSTSHSIVFDSISANPGLIARPYAPLSYGLTLKELEHYYEKSYGADVNPGTVTANGQIIKPPEYRTDVNFIGETSVNEVRPCSFSVNYRQLKRVSSPVAILYSPVTGSLNNIRFTAIGKNVDLPTSDYTISLGEYASSYTDYNGSEIGTQSGYMFFHYTIDSRYGIV